MTLSRTLTVLSAVPQAGPASSLHKRIMASHADAALHTHGLAVRDNKIVALDPVRRCVALAYLGSAACFWRWPYRGGCCCHDRYTVGACHVSTSERL